MRAWTSDRDRKYIEKCRDEIKAKGFRTRITTNKYGVHILWTIDSPELFHDK